MKGVEFHGEDKKEISKEYQGGEGELISAVGNVTRKFYPDEDASINERASDQGADSSIGKGRIKTEK